MKPSTPKPLIITRDSDIDARCGTTASLGLLGTNNAEASQKIIVVGSHDHYDSAEIYTLKDLNRLIKFLEKSREWLK